MTKDKKRLIKSLSLPHIMPFLIVLVAIVAWIVLDYTHVLNWPSFTSLILSFLLLIAVLTLLLYRSDTYDVAKIKDFALFKITEVGVSLFFALVALFLAVVLHASLPQNIPEIIRTSIISIAVPCYTLMFINFKFNYYKLVFPLIVSSFFAFIFLTSTLNIDTLSYLLVGTVIPLLVIWRHRKLMHR